MSNLPPLPPEQVVREMAKLALESATSHLADQARAFAKTLPHRITGREALEAFASAIESTNRKVWPVDRSKP